MKQEQNGFSAIEILLIIVCLGITGFVIWFVLSAQKQDYNTSDNNFQANTVSTDKNESYKIIGTDEYLCTKSVPARCQGIIKVQSSNGKDKNVEVDQNTKFNGEDPANLYKSNKAPVEATIKLDGSYAKSIKLN